MDENKNQAWGWQAVRGLGARQRLILCLLPLHRELACMLARFLLMPVPPLSLPPFLPLLLAKQWEQEGERGERGGGERRSAEDDGR